MNKTISSSSNQEKLSRLDRPEVLQQGAAHYKDTKIEPIEVIFDWKLSFCLGNVIKYVKRAQSRPEGSESITDLQKAIHYLKLEIYDRNKKNH